VSTPLQFLSLWVAQMHSIQGSLPPASPFWKPITHTCLGETDNDGALQAWEFLTEPALRLKAELVVLSACETGLGGKVPGEGLVGLTRALQYAGARSVVASQWEVDDVSTKTLMVAFHAKLRRGVAKDEALREAMTAVAKDPTTAHPYFWAAFVLVGDPENRILGGRPQPAGTR
jgi:CHAT domain-containing protein